MGIEIGDIVVSLIEVIGGAYEPHCVLQKGEITKVVDIKEETGITYYYCGEYCGFVLSEDQIVKLHNAKRVLSPSFRSRL